MGRVVTGAFVVFFPFPLPPLPLPFFDGFLVGFCVVTGACVTGGGAPKFPKELKRFCGFPSENEDGAWLAGGDPNEGWEGGDPIDGWEPNDGCDPNDGCAAGVCGAPPPNIFANILLPAPPKRLLKLFC